jgi:hypothetical protein
MTFLYFTIGYAIFITLLLAFNALAETGEKLFRALWRR